MGMGGGYDAPEPSYQQQALTSKQNKYMGMQMESMQKQEALQETQRSKVMREESTTAAKEAESRSDYRRSGAMGDAVTAQGYGGYRGRDMRGGSARTASRQQYASNEGPVEPVMQKTLARAAPQQGLIDSSFMSKRTFSAFSGDDRDYSDYLSDHFSAQKQTSRQRQQHYAQLKRNPNYSRSLISKP